MKRTDVVIALLLAPFAVLGFLGAAIIDAMYVGARLYKEFFRWTGK